MVNQTGTTACGALLYVAHRARVSAWKILNGFCARLWHGRICSLVLHCFVLMLKVEIPQHWPVFPAGDGNEENLCVKASHLVLGSHPLGREFT